MLFGHVRCHDGKNRREAPLLSQRWSHTKFRDELLNLAGAFSKTDKVRTVLTNETLTATPKAA